MNQRVIGLTRDSLDLVDGVSYNQPDGHCAANRCRRPPFKSMLRSRRSSGTGVDWARPTMMSFVAYWMPPGACRRVDLTTCVDLRFRRPIPPSPIRIESERALRRTTLDAELTIEGW